MSTDRSTSKPAYTLPPLPFDYTALEPVISREALTLHHNIHQGYVDALNSTLEERPEWKGLSIESLLFQLAQIPDDIQDRVRHYGGGHANHQFFWKVLAPKGAKERPGGDLLSAINRDFGGFQDFCARFQTTAAAHRGVGWMFLVANPQAGMRLELLSLCDNDSVLPRHLMGVLVCDLWEHAHYLQYHADRAQWLKNWWQIVNWPHVEARYASFLASSRK